MEPDYARAFRIIRAAFGLKQSELTARMSISVSQLSLIEAGKRTATPKVIEAQKATRVPVELVEVLAASREDVGGKSNREIAEAAQVLLKLLVPNQRATLAPRMRKTG